MWLPWLHAYLADLPIQNAVSRAIGERGDDPDDHVVAVVLAFFRRFPAADGFERVLVRAERNIESVLTGHEVSQSPGYRPSLWDVMISAMMMRTEMSDALGMRVVAVVRKAMLIPAVKPDVVAEVLTWTYADAFRADDLAWLAENIVALDKAGPGRWRQVMTVLVAARRKNPELEYLLLVAGVALIRDGHVSPQMLRTWIPQHGHKTEPWVIALEGALDQIP